MTESAEAYRNVHESWRGSVSQWQNIGRLSARGLREQNSPSVLGCLGLASSLPSEEGLLRAVAA